jgi:hypothetical protein
MVMPIDLNEATAVLRGDWAVATEGKGGYCPVCDRWGKINSVILSGAMVKAMHWIHRAGNGDWVDVPTRAPKFVTRSYVFGQLKHWNMVEQMYIPTPTKEDQEAGVERQTRTSGMWKLTPVGVDFIFNGTSAPERVFVYNDRRVGASDRQVTARDCAREKFSYDAMMSVTFNGDYDELNND